MIGERKGKMYLFVYIFLLLAVMGLYTELFMLRVSRMAENQKGVAETMMVWHGAAYQLAKEFQTVLAPPAATGCFLTPNAAGVAPQCGAGNHYLRNPANAVVLPYTRHYLPVGYNFGEMQFLSKVYAVGSSLYLVTYVPDGVQTLGYTAAQIYRQMKNSGFLKISYGGAALTICNGVNAHWIVTGEFAGANQICYPTSSAGAGGNVFIPDGAVGIVSTLQ